MVSTPAKRRTVQRDKATGQGDPTDRDGPTGKGVMVTETESFDAPAAGRDLLRTGLVGTLAAADLAHAQFRPWSGSSIVRDPEWQKSFLGSYGFLSGAEPKVCRPLRI